MSLYNKIKLAVLGFTLVTLAAPVQAQFFQPLGPIDYYHNFQPFAPVELGFGNTPQPPTDGYFFNYDKLLWGATAGRTVVGRPHNAEGNDHPMFPIWFGNIGGDYEINPITGSTQLTVGQGEWPVDNDAVPSLERGLPKIPNTHPAQYIQPPNQTSTIRDSFPKITFAGGDRYELGYVAKGRGWTLSLLDGPKFDRMRNYGTFNEVYEDQPEDTEEVDEQEEEEDSRKRQWETGIEDGSIFGNWHIFYHPPNFAIEIPPLRTPFGDIFVSFDYPAGLMHGFVDVLGSGEGAQAGGEGSEGSGLGAASRGVGLTDTDGDGIIDGDGMADDVDGDGQFGPDGFAEDWTGPIGVPGVGLQPDWPYVAPPPGPPGTDPDPAEIYSNLVPDYDDLVELPTNFALLTVRSYVDIDGLELMRTHILSNRRYMAEKQNNQLFLAYGARYLRFSDEFNVDGSGGILGYSHWYTSIVNNVIGPQISLRWQNQRGRWSTNVQGRGMLGWNISNWKQQGGIGLNLIRGHYNQPLYLNPTTFEHGQSRGDLSPLAELRIDTSYRISKAVALRFGWSGFYVGNIRRAHSGVKYYLPNMGFRDGNREATLVHGANFGFEVNY